jgi:hypothetical protein
MSTIDGISVNKTNNNFDSPLGSSSKIFPALCRNHPIRVEFRPQLFARTPQIPVIVLAKNSNKTHNRMSSIDVFREFLKQLKRCVQPDFCNFFPLTRTLKFLAL